MATTLGITVCWAQSVPNFSTSFFRLLVAASLEAKYEKLPTVCLYTNLMAKTWSMSQVIQREFNFSSKKSTPS